MREWEEFLKKCRPAVRQYFRAAKTLTEETPLAGKARYKAGKAGIPEAFAIRLVTVTSDQKRNQTFFARLAGPNKVHFCFDDLVKKRAFSQRKKRELLRYLRDEGCWDRKASRGAEEVERVMDEAALGIFQYVLDAVTAELKLENAGSRRPGARGGLGVDTVHGAEADEEPFDPNNEEDTRERTARPATQRDGQPEFRESVIAAYAGKCAITGCAILDVLEAAHILPYRGAHTDKISNGLLLRVDLHRLFDRQLLAIDPETMDVLLAPCIRESEYKKWGGCRLRLPENPQVQPHPEALRKHFEACRNAWGE